MAGVAQAAPVLPASRAHPRSVGCGSRPLDDGRDHLRPAAAAVRAVLHVDVECKASSETNLYSGYAAAVERLSSRAQPMQCGRAWTVSTSHPAAAAASVVGSPCADGPCGTTSPSRMMMSRRSRLAAMRPALSSAFSRSSVDQVHRRVEPHSTCPVCASRFVFFPEASRWSGLKWPTRPHPRRMPRSGKSVDSTSQDNTPPTRVRHSLLWWSLAIGMLFAFGALDVLNSRARPESVPQREREPRPAGAESAATRNRASPDQHSTPADAPTPIL